MLGLHLLEDCMVFVSTLVLLQVLAHARRAERPTVRDHRASTPLPREHMSPHVRQEVDMCTRIAALG